jgi:hypothetical protein
MSWTLRHVLTTSYFTFNGQFYGQTDGVTMGSTLSPIIANFYMEDYEKALLESAPLKLRCWFHYLCYPDKLKDFLHHLNSIHQSIQFTTETEGEGHLPFLDLEFTEDLMALWDTKCTASPHTPISTSTPRPIITHPINERHCLLWCIGPRALFDEDSRQAELVILRNAFTQNGYNDQ